MSEFAKKIEQAAGHSANFEFVQQEQKLGGNAPILAEALTQSGCLVTVIGALGYPDIDKEFLPLTKRCQEVISLCRSGHTTALEFSDGKLLLGQHESVLSIDDTLLIKQIGQKKLIELFNSLDLFVSANWTMILGMTSIWKYLLKSVLPKLEQKKRIAFFDLADPCKRSKKDLSSALMLISEMQKHFQVTLGLNVSESTQVSAVLGLSAHKDFKKRAHEIQKKLKIHEVVIHALDKAAAATDTDQNSINGPYCKHPLITTGGGDNFNAGFCLGLLLNLDQTDCLTLASYTSGYYVRTGKSPTLKELSHFLTHAMSELFLRPL